MGFGLGQSVLSKRTGLPSSGIIVAVEHPQFALMNHFGGEAPKLWSNLYPDWNKKPVYLVNLSKPQKNLSFKEFSDSAKEHGINDMLTIREEYNNLPEVTLLLYPEDDLENFE